MKIILIIIFTAFLTSCGSNKKIYWCGDHPCINKKEREAYFKKNMIVEIKTSNNKNKMKKSEIEKVMQQAKANEKKRIKQEKELAKQAKLEEKKRIKQEKKLAKQAKLEEKRRIKKEKKLAKEAKIEQKKKTKHGKKLKKINKKTVTNKNSSNEIAVFDNSLSNNISEFDEFVEKINKKNMFRPFPDINDIPE